MKKHCNKAVISALVAVSLFLSTQQSSVYAGTQEALPENTGDVSESYENDLIRNALAVSEAGTDYREDEAMFYLGYDPDEKMYGRACEIATRYNGVLVAYNYGAGLIRFPGAASGGFSVAEVVEDSLLNDDVPVIEPNYHSYPMGMTDGTDNSFLTAASPLQQANDPFLKQSNENYQYFHRMIGSEIVWEECGAGSEDVRVAVIDTGVTALHEDLPDIQQMDYFSSEKTPTGALYFPLEPDYSAHGTHVAGIIGAAAGNQKGGAGIAPGVTILSYNVNAAGEEYLNDYAIVAAITNSIKDGVDIINMSLGSAVYTKSEKNAVDDAVKSGITVFAAQGNDSTDMFSYPASYENTIGVAAVGESGAITEFSCFGPSCDIAAPGSAIVSTVVPRLPGDFNKDENKYDYTGIYGSMNGTSMACPVAAGVAALYMSVYGNPGPQKMRELMLQSARKSPLNDIRIVDAAALMGVDRNASSEKPDERRLAICIDGVIMYDPYKKPQMAAGSSFKLKAVLDGEVLDKNSVKWSVVSDDGGSNLKSKAYSKKAVKIDKKGKLTVKSNITSYRKIKNEDISVLVKAELTDGSGVSCEERFLVIKKTGKPTKQKTWTLYENTDFGNMIGSYKKKTITLQDDTYAVTSFKVKNKSKFWVVTSTDPLIAGAFVYEDKENEWAVNGGTRYCIEFFGGSKHGTVTITAKTIDGSGRTLKWKVKN